MDLVSDSLPDKSFRLLVERTCQHLQEGSKLSPLEQELAILINDHPEVGLGLHPRTDSLAELAAIWAVKEQLRTGRPRGIRKLVDEFFPAGTPDVLIRRRLAAIYLELSRGEERPDDGEAYLLALRSRLVDPLALNMPAEDEKDANPAAGYASTHQFRSALLSLRTSLKMEASRRTFSSRTSLIAALGRCPAEWIDAMVQTWNRPAGALKRDKIRDLSAFLMSRGESVLPGRLTRSERQALQRLIDAGGQILYGRLEREFGDESEDDYWWTVQPPSSTIGRLRLKGVLYVGRVLRKTRWFATALIPYDLIPVVVKVLGKRPL